MDQKYKPVRALSRGLAILQALGMAGHATAAELAQSANLDRTTVYRILETLRHEGYVNFDAEARTFSLTVMVRQLADGFTDRDIVRQSAAIELQSLTADVKWPSDFATFHMGAMIIQESTHTRSPYSIHRAMIGRKRPVMRSALGRAVLAASPRDERERMLELVTTLGQADRAEAGSGQFVSALVHEFEQNGYASSIDGSENGISAIAVPIRSETRVVGAINIIFFTRALTPGRAAEAYLEKLCGAARRIEDRISAQLGGGE
ncbi:IclR family transcriptional regulator C-terminal domain-containing protein [Cereibacter sp. SYSU M97828]|nr:IclR family transcriptional regulator C-terminal domain-containing protein [Cereibacter flavus]